MFYSFNKELEVSKNKGERDYIPFDFDYQHPFAQGQLENDKFPDFEPRFSKVILKKKSKVVDVINDHGAIGGYGFVISPKLKVILEKYRLTPTRFYPITASHNNIEYDYYWMQNLAGNNLNWIDYSQSIFMDTKGSYDWDVATEVKFNNANELLTMIEKYSSLYSVKTKSLILNEQYNNNPYDFFYFSQILNGAIISEKLKTELENEKITGLERPYLHSITKAKLKEG